MPLEARIPDQSAFSTECLSRLGCRNNLVLLVHDLILQAGVLLADLALPPLDSLSAGSGLVLTLYIFVRWGTRMTMFFDHLTQQARVPI